MKRWILCCSVVSISLALSGALCLHADELGRTGSGDWFDHLWIDADGGPGSPGEFDSAYIGRYLDSQPAAWADSVQLTLGVGVELDSLFVGGVAQSQLTVQSGGSLKAQSITTQSSVLTVDAGGIVQAGMVTVENGSELVVNGNVSAPIAAMNSTVRLNSNTTDYVELGEGAVVHMNGDVRGVFSAQATRDAPNVFHHESGRLENYFVADAFTDYRRTGGSVDVGQIELRSGSNF